MVTEDVGEKLVPKFAKKADDMNVKIAVVPNGSIEQLRELVLLVASGQVSITTYLYVLQAMYVCVCIYKALSVQTPQYTLSCVWLQRNCM